MKETLFRVAGVVLAGASVFLFASVLFAAGVVPGSAELPVQYVGPDLPNPEVPDGHLMYSPGVQNIQISRANRKHPPLFPDDPENYKGWTYQHHIGIGCWKGRLYAVWDMAHKDEDVPPTHLVYSTSTDGFHWTRPKDLFPHKLGWNLRFYFYHASNGRMLVFACGAYPTDRMMEADKSTLLVREITPDHHLGKVYTGVSTCLYAVPRRWVCGSVQGSVQQ